ncbi:MAG: MBL fold metallo-hydrolase [Leptospiraceae bacterium]|nr:MBL fold metallo-hydrolase [Leptospiraceae bacterium]MCP5512752.1 MBL fold metallo-hydrolase [Leptospiraceae bacterium]
MSDLDKNKSTPIKFYKFISADWEVAREGLINLNDPISKSNKLEKGTEKIQIYTYAIEHPLHGVYFIDSGVSVEFLGKEKPISGMIGSVMNIGKLKVLNTSRDIVSKNKFRVRGIFFTHMHMDHIMGVSDFMDDVQLITGPGENGKKSFVNSIIQGTNERLIGEDREINELVFNEKSNFFGLNAIDYFGDKSFIILYSPGHTVGSLAFLINSESGYQLILGDTCHTEFGWIHNVTPGEFTEDQQMNKVSLNSLQSLAKSIPGIQVHPGHQSLSQSVEKD